MVLEDFLEHELSDQLSRLKSDYVDCFTIDVGSGRSVDLGAILNEEIPAGDAGGHRSYEGGVFLHETVADCVNIMDRFKREGRIRLAAISGENLSVLKRIITKNKGFDAAFVPYNYAFRNAADELIPIASETRTAIVATRPLWWLIRAIPVTVLAQSPFPADRASLNIDENVLTKIACKWPLTENGVTSVMAEAESIAPLDLLAEASTDERWTRADEDAMRKVAEKVEVQQGLLVILSAMNSPDPDIRARGWAAYIKRGLPESGYDPFAGHDERTLALGAIARTVVKDETVISHEGLDDLDAE